MSEYSPKVKIAIVGGLVLFGIACYFLGQYLCGNLGNTDQSASIEAQITATVTPEATAQPEETAAASEEIEASASVTETATDEEAAAEKTVFDGIVAAEISPSPTIYNRTLNADGTVPGSTPADTGTSTKATGDTATDDTTDSSESGTLASTATSTATTGSTKATTSTSTAATSTPSSTSSSSGSTSSSSDSSHEGQIYVPGFGYMTPGKGSGEDASDMVTTGEKVASMG